MTKKTRMVDMHHDSFEGTDAEDRYLDATTRCEGCSMRILKTEVASPAEWSEPYCVLCVSGVPGTCDEDRTARIPVETNAELVWGAR